MGIEIVDLPSYNMVIFQFAIYTFTRGEESSVVFFWDDNTSIYMIIHVVGVSKILELLLLQYTTNDNVNGICFSGSMFCNFNGRKVPFS